MNQKPLDGNLDSLDIFDEDAAHEQVVTFTVQQDHSGMRIDKYLADVSDLSRTYLQTLLDQGNITIGALRVRHSSKKVYENDRVTVHIPAPFAIDVTPEDIDLTIVFEDEDLVVVNKPRGMVAHPGAGHTKGTLVSALLFHVNNLSGIGGAIRPGIVHRIDKDTSGLLVVAKTDLAHHSLSEQLREHSVVRVYEALVHGQINHVTGVIDAPIGRDSKKRQQMAVVPDNMGKDAITHFRVMQRFTSYTHVELRLETGRTHQIRVHMAYIGHPVAGDPVYTKQDPLHLEGQFLHAKTLGFVHPRTQESLLFHASLPPCLQQVLDELMRRDDLSTGGL